MCVCTRLVNSSGSIAMRNTSAYRHILKADVNSSAPQTMPESVTAYIEWYAAQAVSPFPITMLKTTIWAARTLRREKRAEAGQDLEWAKSRTDELFEEVLGYESGTITKHQIWKDYLESSECHILPVYIKMGKVARRPKKVIDLENIESIKFVDRNYDDVLSNLRYESQGLSLRCFSHPF